MNQPQHLKMIGLHSFLAAIAAMILFIDLNIPLGVAAGVPYIMVILIALNSKQQSTPLIWATICTLLTLTGYFLSPQGGEIWKVVANRTLAILAIWSTAIISMFIIERTRRILALETDLQLSTFRSTLGQVAEYANDAVVITDHTGLITWVNHGFTKLSGYELAESVDKKPGALLQGKETDLHSIQQLSDAIRAQKPVSLEILNYHKNGTPYWIDLSINPIFKEGKLEKFVAVERDITERKSLQRALQVQAEQANQNAKATSDFLLQLTQEITKPVEHILHLTSKTEQQSHDDTLMQLNRSITQAAKATKAITNTLTQISQLRPENIQTNHETFDANGLITALCQDIKQLAQYKKIHFSEYLQLEQHRHYQGDPKLSENIIYFFALAALTETDQGTLSIQAKPFRKRALQGIRLEIECTDKGKNYQIFEGVKKASDHSSTCDLTGIAGDYAVGNALISALNGTLDIEHPTDGLSRIVIHLPLIADTNSPSSLVSKTVEPTNQHATSQSSTTETLEENRKLLIAEDNGVNVTVLTKLLQTIGFDDFDFAKNGKEAVKLARNQAYYAILMDNHMPEMTGIEATKIIKSTISPDAYIIACTADSSPDAKSEFIDNGATEVLLKPLNIQKLQAVLIDLNRKSQTSCA
ncbi:response regulator [Thaumasiovibrio subtropicus]|uniref:response regulator n=1 Tax=Thaumasiovibrio subtropicus TaxID=1891207 RepID=UPI000B35BBEB|nr:response regulator [Thaumasiovibrio subtropicus]